MAGPRARPAPTPLDADALALRAERAAALDLSISRLLSRGTTIAVAILAVGVVLMAIAGRSPLDLGFPALDLRRLPADLVALKPEGFLWLGLIAVIVTPISRVTASMIGFARAADRTMVLISIGVLCIIGASVLISAALS